MSEFCQHVDQAGYSQVELHDWFYSGLSPKMQELLITHPGALDTLDELVKACEGIQKCLDTFHRNKHSGAPGSEKPGQSGGSLETVPMDIDAVRQAPGKDIRDFQRAMYGKCWGCGSRDHSQRDTAKCKAPGKHCGYCGGADHFEVVCRDKFLGLEKHRALKKSNPKGKGLDSNSCNVRSASIEEVDEAEERAANEWDALLIRQKELENQLAELRAKAGFQ